MFCKAIILMALRISSERLLQALDVPALPNCCAAAFTTPLRWVCLIQVMKNTLLTSASFLCSVRAGLRFSPGSPQVIGQFCIRKKNPSECFSWGECSRIQSFFENVLPSYKGTAKIVLQEKFKVILLLDFNLVSFLVCFFLLFIGCSSEEQPFSACSNNAVPLL